MLSWPDEGTDCQAPVATWWQPGSNRLLDFHGDPLAAELVVFSDGNHHMALERSLKLFSQVHPGVGEIFYVTTPPAPILTLLRDGRLKIGNFVLTVSPHLFLSPPSVLDSLVQEGHMPGHRPFMKNRGSVLLVSKGNPKQIVHVGDLARDDVRLFLSNPRTETVSYEGYADTLKALAAGEGSDLSFLDRPAASGKIVFGHSIHHREAPEAVASGVADVAVVFYHLALRYLKIFPERFDMIPLGGTVAAPDPFPGNVISFTHAGLIQDGGRWGRRCLDFLFTPRVAEIYTDCGLTPLF
jgi:hypothetical protein